MGLALSDKPPRVPPTIGLGAQPVNIPGIELANVNVTVGRHPSDASKRAMMIGPVILVLPFDDESARQLASAFSGIQIVPANTALSRRDELLQ